jgi:hypothetical protein
MLLATRVPGRLAGGRSALGAETGFTCSILGTCAGATPAVTARFVALQREMNRVRPMFGLPADVSVDGKIGAGTLAKLMKLADRIVGSPNSSQFDNVFDKYALNQVVEGVSIAPTTKVLASEALSVTQALERNGLTMQHYWAAQDQNPIVPTAPKTVSDFIKPILVSANLPTSSPGPALTTLDPYGASASATDKLARMAKFRVAGAVAGGLVIGLGAIAFALRNR